eukprot:GHRR01020107.1.p1 GENE.GHRR01020107.1~~GHRR01020107.1.p1  ORF type:complete len:152 (+),score=29.61 GHRR01020107.1:700-1155(+)
MKLTACCDKPHLPAAIGVTSDCKLSDAALAEAVTVDSSPTGTPSGQLLQIDASERGRMEGRFRLTCSSCYCFARHGAVPYLQYKYCNLCCSAALAAKNGAPGSPFLSCDISLPGATVYNCAILSCTSSPALSAWRPLSTPMPVLGMDYLTV